MIKPCEVCKKLADIKGGAKTCSNACSRELRRIYDTSPKRKEMKMKLQDKKRGSPSKRASNRNKVVLSSVNRKIKYEDIEKSILELKQKFPAAVSLVSHLFRTGLIDEYEEQICHIIDVRFHSIPEQLPEIHRLVSLAIGNSPTPPLENEKFFADKKGTI